MRKKARKEMDDMEMRLDKHLEHLDSGMKSVYDRLNKLECSQKESLAANPNNIKRTILSGMDITTIQPKKENMLPVLYLAKNDPWGVDFERGIGNFAFNSSSAPQERMLQQLARNKTSTKIIIIRYDRPSNSMYVMINCYSIRCHNGRYFIMGTLLDYA